MQKNELYSVFKATSHGYLRDFYGEVYIRIFLGEVIILSDILNTARDNEPLVRLPTVKFSEHFIGTPLTLFPEYDFRLHEDISKEAISYLKPSLIDIFDKEELAKRIITDNKTILLNVFNEKFERQTARLYKKELLRKRQSK